MYPCNDLKAPCCESYDCILLKALLFCKAHKSTSAYEMFLLAYRLYNIELPTQNTKISPKNVRVMKARNYCLLFECGAT